MAIPRERRQEGTFADLCTESKRKRLGLLWGEARWPRRRHGHGEHRFLMVVDGAVVTFCNALQQEGVSHVTRGFWTPDASRELGTY